MLIFSSHAIDASLGMAENDMYMKIRVYHYKAEQIAPLRGLLVRCRPLIRIRCVGVLILTFSLLLSQPW